MPVPPAHSASAPGSNPGVLPQPTPEERARSDALAERIRAEIAAADGAIGFARFMELALYTPALGYYGAAREKFGAAGDYVTAPELGGLYARCLARALAPVLAELGGGDIIEVGAGSGRLAADLLTELAALSALPNAFHILELSGALRARQEATLKQHAPALAGRVRWLERLPPPGFRGVILGNEALDAMPVERFVVRPDGVYQLGIAARDEQFVWVELPGSAATRARVAPLDLPPGYASEINFAAEAWVRSVGEILADGLILLIDYGFPRAEFYHPERAAGTLMCHYRQRAHADPLILLGLQDISAHVDFTAIAEAGAGAGLNVLGYTSQAAFLLGSGLTELAGQSDPGNTRAHLALTQEIKKLTSPAEMGELFKVIGLGRNIGRPPAGFALHDRRARL